MKAISFFDDDIKIHVHTATERDHVGMVMSIYDFAGESPVALYEHGDDLVVYRGGDPVYPERPFIRGEEV